MLVAIVASSCTTGSGQELGSGSPTARRSALPIVHHDTGVSGDALLTGTLILKDQCLYIDAGRGMVVLVAWPLGASAESGAAGSLDVTDGEGRILATVGQEFTSIGGFVGRKSGELDSSFAHEVRAQCLTKEIWFLSGIQVE